jgi:nicotinamidase-related amidase
MNRTVARSTPYSWPYDASLAPSRLALVVVLPAEAEHAAGDGAPGRESSPGPALARIALLAGTVQESGGLVIEVTAAPPRARAGQVPLALANGADAHGLPGRVHQVHSGGIDGFFASSLDSTLRTLGRHQLLLCGKWLETNVHSTMRSANDRGYECLLVLDACVAYDTSLTAAARSQVEMSGGIFGAVGETAAVVDALLSLTRTSTERT